MIPPLQRFHGWLLGAALLGLGANLLCAGEVAAAPAAAPAQTPQRTFLIGAEVHVGDGRVIHKGVVELRDELIVSVGGPELEAKIPKGAKVIDLEGKWLTPGLIASKTPLGLIEIGAERSTRDDSRTGSNAIRAGYDPAPGINVHSSLIPVQAIEGITSAAVTPTGGLLSGKVTWLDLRASLGRDAITATSIAIDGALGQHGGSRAQALTILRRTFDDARFYRRTRTAHDRGQSRPLEAHRLDLEAVNMLLRREIPLTIRADRASDILALLELASDYNIELVIVGATEGWKVAESLAKAKVTVIVQPSENLPKTFDRLGARLDNAAILHAAGVTTAIAIIGNGHNARNITQEAGIAVAYGMDPEAALSAITLNVARAYGMEDRYGSITPGKVANLVVWEDDPFELQNWAEQVYIQGVAIPMRSRQTQLRDRYLDLSRFKR